MKSRGTAGTAVPWALVMLGLAAAGAVWATGPPISDEPWAPRFLTWYSVAWVLYVAAAVVITRAGRLPRWVLVWIVVAALGMRTVCLVRTPRLSTDVWRYLWDGRVSNAGINPFRYPPDAPEVKHLRDGNWRRINFRHISTIYPPTAEMLFAGLARARDSDAEAFRWAFAVFDVGSVLLLIALLRRTGRPAERVIWYAWCPLAVTEATAGAHVDAFALFLLLLAFLLASRSGGNAGPASGVALAAAVMGKGYALLAVPLFVRRGGWRLLIPFVLALLVLVAPFVGARGHMFDGLREYVDRWGTNASIFTVLDRLLAPTTPEHFHITRRISMAAVALVVLALTWRLRPGTEWLLGCTFAAIGAQLLLGAPTLPWYVICVVPALCWWGIPALGLFTLTVSVQYYARHLWPGNEAAHYALLWAGYVPVYAVLIGHVIVWVVGRRRSAPSRTP